MFAAHFILYVKHQEKSKIFYSETLNLIPKLDVPGMTEFQIFDRTILGLMPEKGIISLLGDSIRDPSGAHGIPRAELYLIVDEPEKYHARALKSGAKELSSYQKRSWGHMAAYCSDPDGHVLAFAKESSKQ